MMHMTLYWGKTVTILVDSWRIESWLSYLLSLFALFLAFVFYQYTENRRVRLKFLSRSKSSSIEAPLLAGGRSVTRVSSVALFSVSSAIGYLLMLSVMSFNGGVLLCVVIGLALGYLVFRSAAEDDLISLNNSCACS